MTSEAKNHTATTIPITIPFSSWFVCNQWIDSGAAGCRFRLMFDLNAQQIWCAEKNRSDNSISFDEWHEREVELLDLGAGLTERGVDDLRTALDDCRPLLAAVLDNYETRWDGSNNVGVLNEDGEDYLAQVIAKLPELDATECGGLLDVREGSDFWDDQQILEDGANALLDCCELKGDIAVYDHYVIPDARAYLIKREVELRNEEADDDC